MTHRPVPFPFCRPHVRLFAAALAIAAAAGCGSTAAGGSPDPANEMPFGFVDQPRDAAHMGRTIAVHGWVLDDHGVADVRVFLDGRYVGSAASRVARPDVTKTYSRYAAANDQPGFVAQLVLPDSVATGQHVLLVQVVDDAGLTRDIGSRTIVIDR